MGGMPIRLIASDMDGTLLDRSMRVDADASKAIRAARLDAGCSFIAVTGRSFGEAAPLLADAGITCPMITMNGCELRDPDGEVLWGDYFDVETVAAVIRACCEAGVYAEAYTKSGVCTASTEGEILRAVMAKIRHFRPTYSEERVRRRAPVSPERSKLIRLGRPEDLGGFEPIGKIVLFWDEPDRLAELGPRLESRFPLRAETSFPINMEMVPAGVSKGTALSRYVRDEGIDPGSVMVLGDGMNDVPMFRGGFGLSVAMGNADIVVKGAADAVTDRNDRHGVARAVERFVLRGCMGASGPMRAAAPICG